MLIPLKTLLLLNFVVEALSGLCLMIMPAQTAAVFYPHLAANTLALKFARTTGIAIFVLGLLSVLPLLKSFAPSVPSVLVIFAIYHLLATAHNAYVLADGGESLLPTAIHAVLCAGFIVYLAKPSWVTNEAKASN